MPFSCRLQALLREGLAPAELARALTLGAVIGISPLLWGTGLLCAMIAARLRLNQAAIQLANVAVWPLQLFLFFPWLRLGGWICGAIPGSTVSAAGLAGLVRSYGEANLHALLAWLLVAPLAAALLFSLLHVCCRRLLHPSAGKTTCQEIER